MFCAIIANGSDYIAPNKKVNNIIITNFMLLSLSIKFINTVFDTLSYNLTTVSINLTSACARIPNIIFFNVFGLLLSQQYLSLFHFLFELHFLSPNLHLQWHGTCFVNVFEFILAITLKTIKLTSSLLFGTDSYLISPQKYYNLSLHLFTLAIWIMDNDKVYLDLNQ